MQVNWPYIEHLGMEHNSEGLVQVIFLCKIVIQTHQKPSGGCPVGIEDQRLVGYNHNTSHLRSRLQPIY